MLSLSGSFASELVDVMGDPYPSIDVDGAGHVHMMLPSGGKLRHANDVSGTWQIQDVDDAPSESLPATRVDAIGRAHIL